MPGTRPPPIASHAWRRIATIGAVAAVAAIAVVQVGYVAGCVDGVTPDCSDAATGCGPSLDGTFDSAEAQPLPESGRPDAAEDGDGFVPDANDPDADAGDEI